MLPPTLSHAPSLSPRSLSPAPPLSHTPSPPSPHAPLTSPRSLPPLTPLPHPPVAGVVRGDGVLSYFIALSNSALNPIIYCGFNDNFRKGHVSPHLQTLSTGRIHHRREYNCVQTAGYTTVVSITGQTAGYTTVVSITVSDGRIHHRREYNCVRRQDTPLVSNCVRRQDTTVVSITMSDGRIHHHRYTVVSITVSDGRIHHRREYNCRQTAGYTTVVSITVCQTAGYTTVVSITVTDGRIHHRREYNCVRRQDTPPSSGQKCSLTSTHSGRVLRTSLEKDLDHNNLKDDALDPTCEVLLRSLLTHVYISQC
ncbi:hypothetical protein Hamer_G028967 [Homarus americanus]|uniref:Uncharacterized protein n=1 Tax=Homarus americanus TaxID=6706 RepID=A0A8J5JQ34_HOMAM|nr:hypothetical protein Hamer_G028967 [Homarus americanus]